MSICKLQKNSKLFFGSGGSETIIAITPDKKVFKYFPIIVMLGTPKKSINDIKKEFQCEIHILQELTKKIINKKLSPHLVKINHNYYCDEIPTSFFRKCAKYTKYLLDKHQTPKQCNYIYRGYPHIVASGMYVCEIEYCQSSLSDVLQLVIKKNIGFIKIFLDILLFQIFFTLEIIKQSYPMFIHNDLFIRNILVGFTGKKGKYDRYIFKSKLKKYIFDVPAEYVNVKINDFGLTQLDKKTTTTYYSDYTIVHNTKRDYFNILWDLYNGGNLGSGSLSSLTKNENKQKFIKKYFSQFMNIGTLDKIVKNDKKQHLDFDWNNTLDQQFVKLIDLSTPVQFFNYFKNIFQVDDSHEIINIYGDDV